MSPRSLLLSLSIATVVSAIGPPTGQAQLTVQQPVFEVTNVATTVSVPDRGRAHLGSIGRTRDSRTSFGPFRPGTNTGLDRQHSGMSVGVYIHDFEAMDQYLLSQGASAATSSAPRLSRNARHAWNQLQAQHGARPTVTRPDSTASSKSEKYWLLGQKAEREGNVSVARLHYRIASRYGSEAAQSRLAALDSADPTTSATASAQ